MKRLAIAAVGFALVVGVVTGCRSSGYSQAEVEGAVSVVQTANAEQQAPTATAGATEVPTAEGGGSGGLRNPTQEPMPEPYQERPCVPVGDSPRDFSWYPCLPPDYSPEEAVGFVRAALDHLGTCRGVSGFPFNRWAAVFEPDQGSWLVAVGCAPEEGPPLDAIPPQWAKWRFYEDSYQVIPLNDSAAEWMRPERE